MRRIVTVPADLERLAAELDAHWVEIGRFFLSRKLRSKVFHGAGAELSPVQLRALALLLEGPARVGELADDLGLAESTVTRLVDRLEHHGLAARRALPDDRRSVAVQLTVAGRRVASSVERDRRAYLTEILGTLERGERSELVRLIAKVAAAQAKRQERVLPGKVAR
jgi:DNA-binding MarR family transcriptional regulator